MTPTERLLRSIEKTALELMVGRTVRVQTLVDEVTRKSENPSGCSRSTTSAGRSQTRSTA